MTDVIESWTPRSPSPKADLNGRENGDGTQLGSSRGILYLDEQRLTRDCISRELARHFPELSIETRATAQELVSDDCSADEFALVVLHAHTGRVDDGNTLAELSMLDQVLPDPPLVLLSDVDSADNIVAAFRRGIRGYIPTTLALQEAVAAIRFVSVGGTFVPPSILSNSEMNTSISERVDVTEERHDRRPEEVMPGNFSPRQREVLHRLWMGKPNKTIAYELNMCESTVKVHIRQIMKKLNATNRTQIVVLTRPSFTDDGALGNAGATSPMLQSAVSDEPLRIASPSHRRRVATFNSPIRSKDEQHGR
jgi:DNA-binding NarL/FixJ family response regulator